LLRKFVYIADKNFSLLFYHKCICTGVGAGTWARGKGGEMEEVGGERG